MAMTGAWNDPAVRAAVQRVVATTPLSAPMFWCLTCHRRTTAEWDEYDPATTSPPIPFCPRCGEHYQCGECGFEIDLLGDCQRLNSTGDDTCSTTTKGSTAP